MDEARAHYDAALAIVREVGDRRTEGTFLGKLGALELRLGRCEEAQAAFARGELLLREVGERLELGKLLCRRGDLERTGGDLAAARSCLAEVEALAAAIHAGPDSELGRELAKLRQALTEP